MMSSYRCDTSTKNKKQFSDLFNRKAFKTTHSPTVSAIGCLQLFPHIPYSRRHTIVRVVFPLTRRSCDTLLLFSFLLFLVFSRYSLGTIIQTLILGSMLSEYIYHCEHELTNYPPLREAYNFPEQYILRVLISLPTNKTSATFVVSTIVAHII